MDTLIIALIAWGACCIFGILLWKYGTKNEITWQIVLGAFLCLFWLGLIISIIQICAKNSKRKRDIELERIKIEKVRLEFEKKTMDEKNKGK